MSKYNKKLLRKKNMLFLTMFITAFVFIAFSFCLAQTETAANDTTHEKTSAIKRVAILPFDNVSGDPDAAKRITNILLTQLFSKNKVIKVVELGEVEKALIEERVRNTGEIDIETAKKLGKALNVEYLILGSVVEYKMVRIGNNDYPVVGVTARALDAKTGSIIWSDHGYGRGNQREKIFGIGRIISFSELSEIVVDKIVNSFVKKVEVLNVKNK